MVVKSKTDSKAEFSRRLVAAIKKRFDVPERGMTKWLWARLRDHVKPRPALVSYESCRKWLRGKEIPIPANMMVLCDALGIPMSDLVDDELRTYMDSQEDPEIAALIKKFKNLNDAGRKYVLAAIDMATKAEAPVELVQKKTKIIPGRRSA